jgi:hypothetical protein
MDIQRNIACTNTVKQEDVPTSSTLALAMCCSTSYYDGENEDETASW